MSSTSPLTVNAVRPSASTKISSVSCVWMGGPMPGPASATWIVALSHP